MGQRLRVTERRTSCQWSRRAITLHKKTLLVCTCANLHTFAFEVGWREFPVPFAQMDRLGRKKSVWIAGLQGILIGLAGLVVLYYLANVKRKLHRSRCSPWLWV
eukprot:s325_g18.t3